MKPQPFEKGLRLMIQAKGDRTTLSLTAETAL